MREPRQHPFTPLLLFQRVWDESGDAPIRYRGERNCFRGCNLRLRLALPIKKKMRRETRWYFRLYTLWYIPVRKSSPKSLSLLPRVIRVSDHTAVAGRCLEVASTAALSHVRNDAHLPTQSPIHRLTRPPTKHPGHYVLQLYSST